jgi:demethylmenaquinone methyltransferase/2-methoxy-6-polyprenyl-1,4-benzoquinol methylase
VEIGVLPRGEEKRAQVRQMFDRIAPRYDLLNRLLTGGLDRRWRRLAVEAVGVVPRDRVLDLACGTGDLCELAAARGARVVGVDFAGAMLRRARARGSGAAFVRGDAVALPLPEAWATVALCGFALRNFVSVPDVLTELRRVLAPGARVALLEVDRPGHPLLRAGHRLYFDGVVPRLGGLLSDRAAYTYLPRSTVYLPPAEEFRVWIEKAGFCEPRRRSLLLGAAQLWTAVSA